MINSTAFPKVAFNSPPIRGPDTTAKLSVALPIPMYPSDYASSLESLTLKETSDAIRDILSFRDENVWMLFGTLPFYPCSSSDEDLELLQTLYKSKNVSVRNDPDGRSRLNVNIFTGDVIVTDFGDIVFQFA